MPIDSHLSYLEKNAYAGAQIHEPPAPNLGIVVVIPVFNEPTILPCLQSLAQCKLESASAEVLVVVNASVDSSSEIQAVNLQALEEAKAWASRQTGIPIQFHFLHFPHLPTKDHGIGLARKLGMDEAVRRLGPSRYDAAPIACLDADCTVAPNYLEAVRNGISMMGGLQACSIYFEHDLSDPRTREAITRIELYKRYAVQALRKIKHPQAYHSLGSAMAISAGFYQAQGGMNKRRSGEDFHFVHKLTHSEDYGDLVETCVYPSARIGGAIHGGTGQLIEQYLQQENPRFMVFAPAAFRDLGEWLKELPKYWNADLEAAQKWMAQAAPPLQAWLMKVGFLKHFANIRASSKKEDTFKQRFFRWLTVLEVIHYLNFVHQAHYQQLDIQTASAQLLDLPLDTPHIELLQRYRQLDRTSIQTRRSPMRFLSSSASEGGC